MEYFRSAHGELESCRNESLIRNFLTKLDLLSRSDRTHESIKTALVVDGGGMNGMYGGVGSGHQKLKITDVLNWRKKCRYRRKRTAWGKKEDIIAIRLLDEDYL